MFILKFLHQLWSLQIYADFSHLTLLRHFLFMVSSERALLNRLMIELHKLDSDVLVGHNISGFDLDVLLHRAQVGISVSAY